MAYTMSTIVNTVIGNERLWSGYITADAAATSVIIPGATVVDAVLACHAAVTAACGCIVFTANQGPVGTAALGSVAMTSCASSKYLLTVLYH
jgi:hypothetical protein